MKKILITLILVLGLVSVPMAAQMLVGGNVPLVNTIVGIGELSLDFSGAGSGVQVASFIINNNSQEFDVSWQFMNGGQFEAGLNVIPFIAPLTFEDGGLGAWGAAAPATVELVGDQIAGIGAAIVMSSGVQTEATINKKVVIKASWDDASAKLAGLYTEQIVFSIVVTTM